MFKQTRLCVNGNGREVFCFGSEVVSVSVAEENVNLLQSQNVPRIYAF